ncbi:MAG TPA: hypothetical protein VK186_05815 [Candidatus Deferrimicrobium sp.]|nr:hypothetical protein [Candidatus Deferrimicrobium sp.]
MIDEVRRHPLLKERKYFRYPISVGMDLEKLFVLMAPALGCRDEFPKGNFFMLGKYNFSSLKKYAQYSSPSIIHLEHAHRFIDNGQFKDPGIVEFLKTLATEPKFKIIIESREETGHILPPNLYKHWEVHGIDEESMAAYFRRPFKDRPGVGWVLDDPDNAFIYSWLGGKDLKRGAHPLAMVLLSSLADGKRKTPAQILKNFEERNVMVQDLESQLFNDLYEQVLSPSQQHLLRLFSLYREGIPDLHMGRLSEAVGDKNAFQKLKQRCLLTSYERDDWYYLHALISRMTEKRIDFNSPAYCLDSDIIAGAWCTQLKISSHISPSNIRAAGEAFYHLTEAGNYEGYYELSDELLGKDVIPFLAETSRNLSQAKKYKEDRCVLDLLVKLEPHEPKYHRFLAQTIEKLKGKGDDEAFEHYQEAYRLSPKFPPNLNNLGVCMMSRGNAREFVSLLESLTPVTFRESTNNHTISIYANCLEQLGEDEKASRVRREQIDAGSTNPAFYADEANYLLNQENYPGALEIIGKAEARKCADNFTLAIKARCFEKSGREDESSRVRREQIDAGAANPAFYNDEANYLLNNEHHLEALEIIGKAEARKCANEYTLAIKARCFEKSGREDESSRVRREQIDAGSTYPAFYNDEANYLIGKNRYDEARAIIAKAEKVGCADEFTSTIKAKLPD